MSKARVVLWDIDGTLINMNGGVFDAFDAAVPKVTGRPLRLPSTNFHGTTDSFILDSYFRHNGVPEKDLPAAMAQGLEGIRVEMAAMTDALRQRATACVGGSDAVRAVKRAGALNTVLTGNILENAELKLDLFGLGENIDFSVGAFGDDSTVRSELVGIALKRVADKYGLQVAPDQVWIVGDTPSDLKAARENGIKVALVANGHFAPDDLAALEPDLLISDLREVQPLLEAMGLARTTGVELR